MEWEGPDLSGVMVERFEVFQEVVCLGWREEDAESFCECPLKH